jgi:hypothetical protein
VQEGPEGIMLYPIRGNLSNCERGMRVLCYIQQAEMSHPVLRSKTRFSSYVCLGINCHTYDQNYSISE